MAGIDSLLDKYDPPAAPKTDGIDSLLDKYDPPKDPNTVDDKINASLEGAGNVFSLGQLPKLQAMAQVTQRDPGEDVDNKLRAQGVKITQPDWYNYENALNENLAKRQSIAKDMPNQYYGSGMAAAGLMAAPAVASGAGALKTGVQGLLGHTMKDAMKNAVKVGIPAYVVKRIMGSGGGSE